MVNNKAEIPSEAKEQQMLAKWLRVNNITFYAIPNGGGKNKNVARGQYYQGVQAGVPDLCLPIARAGWHGLYVELKRIDGGKGLSVDQERWLKVLRKHGYKAIMCKGFVEAKKAIYEYLKLEDLDKAFNKTMQQLKDLQQAFYDDGHVKYKAIDDAVSTYEQYKKGSTNARTN